MKKKVKVRRYGVGAFIIVSLAVTVCLVAVSRRPEWNRRCRGFTRGEVGALLQEKGQTFEELDRVRRNKDGSGILVYGVREGGAVCARIDIGDGSVQTWAAPSRISFGGEHGTFLAWLEQGGSRACFAPNGVIELPEHAAFDVDPEGRYYIVGDTSSDVRLGRVRSPGSPERLPDKLSVPCVFAEGKRVFVCGLRALPSSSFTAARCLVLADEGDSFRLIARHDLRRWDIIVDKDPLGDRLLVVGGWEFGKRLYVYDLVSGKRRRLGPASDFNVFLRGEWASPGQESGPDN